MFEFHDVPTGMYNLRLTSSQGAIVSEQVIDLVSFTNELTIQIPKRRVERPASGVVSVGELQHAVSPKAFRALVDAQREADSGREFEAIRKLKRAI